MLDRVRAGIATSRARHRPRARGAGRGGSARGGVHLAEEAQVDPPAMLRALQQACAARGVVFRSGTLVRGVSASPLGVQTSEGMVRGDSVIIAAGSWSSLVDGLPAGVRNVRPVRGQIVQVDTRPPV